MRCGVIAGGRWRSGGACTIRRSRWLRRGCGRGPRLTRLRERIIEQRANVAGRARPIEHLPIYKHGRRSRHAHRVAFFDRSVHGVAFLVFYARLQLGGIEAELAGFAERDPVERRKLSVSAILCVHHMLIGI
jgi:hypothetical protein